MARVSEIGFLWESHEIAAVDLAANRVCPIDFF
jgi:hypothetical protein